MSFKPKQWKTNGWYYDDTKGKWIGPDFPDEKSILVTLMASSKKARKQPPKPSKDEPKWYPNGWYYDEAKGIWTGPDYQTAEEAKEQEAQKARYYERRKAYLSIISTQAMVFPQPCSPQNIWMPWGWKKSGSRSYISRT